MENRAFYIDYFNGDGNENQKLNNFLLELNSRGYEAISIAPIITQGSNASYNQGLVILTKRI